MRERLLGNECHESIGHDLVFHESRGHVLESWRGIRHDEVGGLRGSTCISGIGHMPTSTSLIVSASLVPCVSLCVCGGQGRGAKWAHWECVWSSMEQ